MTYINRVPFKLQAAVPFTNTQSFKFVTDDGGGQSTSDYMYFTNFFKKQGNEPWSISAWLNRPTNLGLTAIVCQVFNNSSSTDGDANDGILFWMRSFTSDEVSFVVSFDTDVPGEALSAVGTSATSWVEGAWTHVVVTYDGSFDANNFGFYLNGSNVPVTSPQNGMQSGDTIPYNSSVASIGQHDGWSSSIGAEVGVKIDEVSLWNVELSSSEVSEVYNSGTAGDLSAHSQSSNLEAWINFDNDTIDSGNTVNDEQGNHNGTYSTGTGTENSSVDVP